MTLQQQVNDDVARLGPLYRGDEPQRMSTKAELAQWMNELSSKYGTGVVHDLTADGQIRYTRFRDKKVVEVGLLN